MTEQTEKPKIRVIYRDNQVVDVLISNPDGSMTSITQEEEKESQQ